MSRTLEEIQIMMVEQIKRRGFYPKDVNRVMLHIGEEVGELFQIVRKEASFQQISNEVADVFWHLLRFCELQGIDLEQAFLEKYEINETRPLNDSEE